MGWRSGISTYGLPHVQSYEGAQQAWEKAQPIRNAPTRRRLRRDDRSKFIDIETDVDDSTMFTLVFNSEQVTYHRDESITIRPGYSAGDTVFSNHMLPSGVDVTYHDNRGRRVTAGGWCYLVNECMRLRRSDGGYAPEKLQQPWVWPRLDVKAAHEALKGSKYHDFKLWVHAAVALGGVKRPVGLSEMTTAMGFISQRSVAGACCTVEALAEPSRWWEIAGAVALDFGEESRWPVEAADLVRMALYVECKALTIEKHERLHHSDVSKVYRDNVKYRAFVRGYV